MISLLDRYMVKMEIVINLWLRCIKAMPGLHLEMRLYITKTSSLLTVSPMDGLLNRPTRHRPRSPKGLGFTCKMSLKTNNVLTTKGDIPKRGTLTAKRHKTITKRHKMTTERCKMIRKTQKNHKERQNNYQETQNYHKET